MNCAPGLDDGLAPVDECGDVAVGVDADVPGADLLGVGVDVGSPGAVLNPLFCEHQSHHLIVKKIHKLHNIHRTCIHVV